ncbi:MAG TPA: redoxin domain-containing protein [Prosthecobacter sp.]|nr:redoxin domain-containing protein [Prosthecobacter sp.]
MNLPRSIFIIGLVLFAWTAPTLADDGGQKLINTKPPEWQVNGWLNSPPLKLADLRGKVVLIRWWTAPGCPYCAATAPALNEFHEQYPDLVVIGLYHHKIDQPLTPDHVATQAERLGFMFPVAVDTDWKTLHQWWLDTGDRDFTSVSFLIDKAGRIQHIHPGGEYPKDSKDYRVMKGKIEGLLKEP